MSEEAWKTIPWTNHTKKSKDLLLDVVVDVPELLEISDALAISPTLEGFRNLIKLYNAVDKGLTAWYGGAAPLARLEDLFQRGLETASAGDYAVVEIMTIYWTMCLLTYVALHQSLKRCSGIPGTETSMDHVDMSSRIDPRQYCKRITEVVGIFFQPSAGIMYSKSAAFPMGVAMGYLMYTDGLGSEDAKKLLELFSTSPRGNTMGKFIKGSVSEWGSDFGGPRPPVSKGPEREC